MLSFLWLSYFKAVHVQIPVIKLVAEVPTDSDISRESSSIVHIPDTHSTQIHEIPDPNLSSSDCSSCHIDSKRTRNDSVDAKSIHLDISFKSSSHTGLQTSELVICFFFFLVFLP